MIIPSNQVSAYIDRWGHGDWKISLCSMNSGIEMGRIGFGLNINDGIGVNPPITIRKPILHITSNR